MQTIVRLARLIWPYRKYLIVTILAVLGDTATGLLQPWPLKMVFDNVFRLKHLAPGFVMALTHLFSAHSNPSRDEIRGALSGNLCRCSGYVKIVEAAERLAKA